MNAHPQIIWGCEVEVSCHRLCKRARSVIAQGELNSFHVVNTGINCKKLLFILSHTNTTYTLQQEKQEDETIPRSTIPRRQEREDSAFAEEEGINHETQKKIEGRGEEGASTIMHASSFDQRDHSHKDTLGQSLALWTLHQGGRSQSIRRLHPSNRNEYIQSTWDACPSSRRGLLHDSTRAETVWIVGGISTELSRCPVSIELVGSDI